MRIARIKGLILTQRNRILIRVSLLVIVGLLTFAALILPYSTRPSAYTINRGDVAPQDITAPTDLSFQSAYLTDQARKEAEKQVSPIYLPADPAIARRQVERLRNTLNYISAIRIDSYASSEQKLSDLSAMSDLFLSTEDAIIILAMNEARWDETQKEALSVLEQVMRGTIREDQLIDTQRRISSLISFSFPQDLSGLVTTLASPFVKANSLFSAEQTQLAIEQTRQSIEPINRTYLTGEVIVRRGQVINDATWEVLEQFGLIQTKNSTDDFLATTSLVVVAVAYIAIYFSRRKNVVVDSLRATLLISLLFLLFLFAARLVIPNRTVLPYLFPLSAFAFTITGLFSLELGLVLQLLLSILVAFGVPNALDLTIYYIISAFVGVLVLNKGLRIGAYLGGGFAAGIAGSAIIIAYRLTSPNMDWVGILTLIGASFFNGMASASLTLIFQYFLAQVLGKVTALQLLELSRPDHPLLQIMLQKAPGSYQHSLQVSVLAEQAAEKVGADALLVRVGGMYHDVGKSINPAFFIENQSNGKLDAHDNEDPIESAQTVIKHITDGVAIARRYRLPPRIQDFIREHHGTLMTRYMYVRALEAAGGDKSKVDPEHFRYPGPIPASRETALLMLADGTQARVRAESPQTEEELTEIVRKTIDFCQHENQLDNTRLTLRDLHLITESFVETLKTTYHPRIKYPEIKSETPVSEPTLPVKPQ